MYQTSVCRTHHSLADWPFGWRFTLWNYLENEEGKLQQSEIEKPICYIKKKKNKKNKTLESIPKYANRILKILTLAPL